MNEFKPKVLPDAKVAAAQMRPLLGTHFGQVAQITEHVFLCSAQPLQDPRMDSMNFSLVVSATLEPPVLLFKTDSLQVPLDDAVGADIGRYFDLVADRVDTEARQCRRVLVHCAAGVSRSAALVLAYLVKHAGLSLRQAHTLCKRRRPFVRPNTGFWRQLCAFELSRRGQQTVRMVRDTAAGGDSWIPDIYLDEVSGGSGTLCWIPLTRSDSRPKSDNAASKSDT